jgi:VanZ family protein
MVRRKATTFLRWFIYLYIVAFAILAYLHHNHEFFYYSIVYLLLLLVIYLFQRRYKFSLQLPGLLLLGFAILGLAHFAGGLLFIKGVRLYDVGILSVHYDNIVHAFGSFLLTIASFNLIFPYLHERIFSKKIYLLVLLLLISLGIGSINENIEFSAYVFLKTTGVGGYYNNATDLVFNLVGALMGCVFVLFFLLKKKLERGALAKTLPF